VNIQKLSVRLALWMLLVTISIQLLNGVYHYHTDLAKAQSKAEDELQRVVQSIYPALAESLFQYNERLSDQLLRTFDVYPSVQAVWLLDDQDEGVGAWIRSNTGYYEEWVELDWPISYDGHPIGRLAMAVQWGDVKHQAQNQIIENILSDLVMGFISLILLYWVAQWLITHPIVQLQRYLSSLNPRHLDQQDVEPLRRVWTHAELTELKQALIQILEALSNTLSDKANTMEILQRFNQSLDQQVNERTRELAAAKEKAENANRSKTDFMNTMTHELRTPLNSIMGFSSILRGKELPDRLAKLVDNIHQSGDHLLTLINDIIDFVGLEGKPLNSQIFSVVDVVQAAVVELKEEATAKGLDLKVDVDTRLVLEGDPKRMNLMLRHLLGNAIKFTESGFVSIRAEGRSKEYCDVVVVDSGVGIDIEQATALKESFVQLDQGLNRKKEGVGLGLAVIDRIVRKWNGHWQFVLPEQGGTEVQVRLPNLSSRLSDVESERAQD